MKDEHSAQVKNTPVRIGILGCAAVAEYALMDVLSSVPQLEVSAIASRNRDKAREFAQRHGIHVIRSYEELLDDPDLDVIYIPLPNSMHCEWSVRAMEAGKDVICEKPLASNADEAGRMVETELRTGRILVEAFHWRYHPLCSRVVEIVQAGTLAELRRVDVSFLLPRKLIPDDNIRWQYDMGGGATMDTGCYCVNFLRLLLGEPERVIYAAATASGTDVDGRMQAELQFRNGCIGSIHASQLEEGDAIVNTAEITGSKGQLRVTRPFTPHWGNKLELEAGGKVTTETTTEMATYVFQARAFADIFKRGAPIPTPAMDGLANMQVIDAIYRAAGLPLRGLA